MAERDPFGRLSGREPARRARLAERRHRELEPAAAGRRGAAARRRRRRPRKPGDSPHDEPASQAQAAPPGAGRPGSPEATLRDLLASVQPMKAQPARPRAVARDVGRIVKAVFVLAIIVVIVSSLGGLDDLSGSVGDGVSDSGQGRAARGRHERRRAGRRAGRARRGLDAAAPQPRARAAAHAHERPRAAEVAVDPARRASTRSC